MNESSSQGRRSAGKATRAQTDADNLAAMTRILRILDEKVDIDFSHYRDTTIQRQLERRLSRCRDANLTEYVTRLEREPGEAAILLDSLLLSVTEFFRHPQTFAELDRIVFPSLVKQMSARNPLRIWVPGCSTGEDVYSIAMALSEYCDREQINMNCQFFGTDISARNVDAARNGTYRSRITRQVSADRQKRFFEQSRQGYRVSRLLRERCIFARHDITRDPPFPNIDLLMCRNVLIYFDQVYQGIAFSAFHFSLKPDGFLVLGPSESLGLFDAFFKPVDKRTRIFRKKENSPEPIFRLHFPRLMPKPRGQKSEPPAIIAPRVGEPAQIRDRLQQVLCDRYAPPGVLIDDAFQMREILGNVEHYLQFPRGEVSHKLSRVARDGIMPAVCVAVREAAQTRQPSVKRNTSFVVNGVVQSTDIVVVPIPEGAAVDPLYLVLFEEPKPEVQIEKRSSLKKRALINAASPEVDMLRQELSETRRHLQAMVEEKEHINQELWAGNEEIQSVNEELQSMNEELEGAKEELESANEEMAVMNAELQKRNVALSNVTERLRMAQQAGRAGTWDWDIAGETYEWSPEFFSLTGIDPLARRSIDTLRRIIHPDDWSATEQSLLDAVRGGTELNIEYRIVLPDGSGRWLRCTGQTLYDNGQPVRMIGLCIDITDIKQAEAAMRQRAEEMAAVSALASAVSTSLSMAEVADIAIAGIRAACECDVAMVFARNGEALDILGATPKEDALFIRNSAPHQAGECLCGLAEQTRLPQYSLNIHADHRCTRPECRHAGFTSFAALPLMNGAEVIGVVGLASWAPRDFSAQDRFLTALTGQLAGALINARLYGQLQVELVERQRAEDAARRESEFSRLMIANAGQGICVCQGVDEYPYVRFSVWNDRMIEITGYTMDEINRLGWVQTVYPDGAVRERALDRMNAMRDGNDIHGEIWDITRSDGQVRSLLITMRLFLGIEDENPLILGVMSDVTEVRRTEEMLQKSQRLESLGALAGGIAHDFNNLLAGIFGCIELASSRTNEERVTRYLDNAMNTIDRARALTGQLLTFARGGSPIKELQLLVPFLEDTVKFALSGANVSCRFSLVDDLWSCEFDKGQMSQVVENLISNAQQAMNDGGTVEVHGDNLQLHDGEHPILPAGRYARVSIVDHGTGIEPEILPRIFDPFFTTRSRGHGLGLATAYSIVKRHAGAIDVASKPGEGSTFTILLPAAVEMPVSAENREVIDHRGQGMVLVMDDEPLVRETLGSILKSFGYQVEYRADGEEALTFFKQKRAQIVAMFFDLTIPGGMGGKDAVNRVRCICKELPVFVSSGYADDPAIADPAAYGFTDSIAKPFSRVQLARMLNRHIKTCTESDL